MLSGGVPEIYNDSWAKKQILTQILKKIFPRSFLTKQFTDTN